MEVYNDKRKKVGILTRFRNRTITTTLDSGDKELSFEYPAEGKLAGVLKEECYIRTKKDEFVLKEVERGETVNKYTAVLNVEELEGTMFPYGFESREQTVTACLSFAFEGTGWSVGTCTIAKKRTIREEESVSAWDILQKCLSTYRCECMIDSLNKLIDIYEQIGSDKGCYFMEGLNLRKLTLKSDTYDFYTRIYPIGADGITPGWVIGQDYIENNQYSEKVKAYVWKDERYTNTTSLIEDATAKLAEASRPYKAYTAEVADLAKMSEKYKDILEYGIGDTITLVSESKRIREKQRIVKLVEYPEQPEKNTAEVSNSRKTFAQIQQEETESARQEAISISSGKTKKLLENYSTTEEVETRITAAEEEINLGVKGTLKGYYSKTETEALIKVAKEETNLSVSKTYQTKSGMGDYAKSETMRSELKILADGLAAKVSKGDVVSEINQTSETVKVKAKQFIVEGGNFTLDEEGNVYVRGAGEFTDKFSVCIPRNPRSGETWDMEFQLDKIYMGSSFGRDKTNQFYDEVPCFEMKATDGETYHTVLRGGHEIRIAPNDVLTLEVESNHGSIELKGGAVTRMSNYVNMEKGAWLGERPAFPAHDGASETTGRGVSMVGEHTLSHDWLLFADTWFFVTIIDTTAFWSTYYNKS